MMRSAMAAVARAGGMSWTRRMWAPARMAAVFATAVGSVAGEADPSAALHPSEPGPLAGGPGLRDDSKGALRDDNKAGSAVRADDNAAVRGQVRKLLRERPARMGKPSVWSWSRCASRG